MNVLQEPDCRHLSFATGWLELGNWREANDELEKIAPALRAHPDVLQLRFEIHAKAEQWTGALIVAQTIARIAPKRLFGWIESARVLHKLNRTEEARQTLAGVLDRFPRDWQMRFELACYECQLGHTEAVWALLAETFKLKDTKEVRLRVLDASELTPFWEHLGKM